MPTLLALIPHPDDESYSFGGTIALAARAGWRCVIECASAGERGKRHDGGPTGREAVGTARMQELSDSCRVLGAEPPRFWDLPDGGFREGPSQVPRITRLFEEFAPDLVLTLSPDGAYGHPDHIAMQRWVREAWEEAGPDVPELLYPVFPRGLFVPQWQRCIDMLGDPPSPAAAELGSDAFDYEVPIAAVAETKREAIAAHRTQLPGGDPEAIFPPGIVAALLSTERFQDARGSRRRSASAALAKVLREISS